MRRALVGLRCAPVRLGSDVSAASIPVPSFALPSSADRIPPSATSETDTQPRNISTNSCAWPPPATPKGLTVSGSSPAQSAQFFLVKGRCGRFLGLPEGVDHVFVRRSTTSGSVLHQAGQAGWTHHPPARLSDEERPQGMASGVRATPRFASSLHAHAEVFADAAEAGCQATSGNDPLATSGIDPLR